MVVSGGFGEGADIRKCFCFGSYLEFQSFRGTVNVEFFSGEEADQGELGLVGNFDGEAAGGADSYEDGDSHFQGFLDNFIAGSS